MRYLIDSNMIIYYLANHLKACDFIDTNINISAISRITYYEVLNYNFTRKQEKNVKLFLEFFKIIEISKEIVDKSLQNRKVKKIKMGDNFILATAQINDLLIVTNNEKDFKEFIETVNPI